MYTPANSESSYNSAVYSSIYARDYLIFSANEQSIDPHLSNPYLDISNSSFGYATAQTLRRKALAHALTRLENQDCINAYATAFQTQRGSIILVSNDTDQPAPVAENALESIFVAASGGRCSPHPFQWICGGNEFDCPHTDSCSTQWQSIDAANWSPFGNQIEYCLSGNVNQLCRLQFNETLAIIVIVFNAIKVLTLIYVFFAVKENPLLTMGDAVASFLKRPDDTTRGLCLVSKRSIKQWSAGNVEADSVGVPYDPTRKSWSTAVSKVRWAFCMTL